MDVKPKILVCVVAYNAENHIEEVLSRIPANFLYSKFCSTHVLVLDDASKDNTTEVAKNYALRDPSAYTVIKNMVNQGYGGNQKIGYTYAIEHGYDAVILLHGDAQYAPELLPEMAQPIIDGKADVVLGSRMIEKKNALKGKMPLYKFIGNIALTKMQNLILGSNLSEFHTGYRAYSTKALKAVPFTTNSNFFEFDTDILIQMIDNKFNISEIAIPTRYGDEVCHVNGMKYAALIMYYTLLSRLCRMNVLKLPKFDYSRQELAGENL